MDDILLQSEITTESTEKTQEIARKLLDQLDGRTVIALIGDLGSGKTTFSQGIGKALGIERHLQSPTFTIVKQYQLANQQFEELYHVDLYRLDGTVDITQIGLDDAMEDPKNLVLIEWAEKMRESLPQKRIEIVFEYIDEEKRKMTIRNF